MVVVFFLKKEAFQSVVIKESSVSNSVLFLFCFFNILSPLIEQ